ncbi:MAG: hypothetical protein HFH29_05030 [Eubacterium sp.]|nr:hypothetical protein [Eubacterium sp.]
MSNLYKAQINQSKDGVYTRVIDHNELLEQKLSAISFEQEQKLRQQRLAQGGADLESADQEADSQGHTFSEGLFAAKVETAPELEIDFVEKAKEEAAEITAKATADAEEILKRAVQEAEKLKENTRKQAEEKGYAQGMERARTQEAQMMEQVQQLRQQHEQEYAERLRAMEPELMDAVIEVFDHVLWTDFAGRREILLRLIQNTVRHIKNSREFRIRVCAEDYETVSAGRDEILKKIGGDVILDIIMDESMQQGQCTIDTDEGIFDCGVDVQLDNLIKDLKTLSCIE